jgi:hypothetical protein
MGYLLSRVVSITVVRIDYWPFGHHTLGGSIMT